MYVRACFQRVRRVESLRRKMRKTRKLALAVDWLLLKEAKLKGGRMRRKAWV